MPERKRLLTPADIDRIAGYETRTALLNSKFLSQVDPDKMEHFRGQIIRALALNKPIGQDSTERMVLSTPAFISETWSELLFLEAPEITSAAQSDAENEWLSEFVTENDLHPMWLEDAIDTSALGEVVWKLRMDEGADVPSVETLDPRLVVPRFNPMNRRDVRRIDVLAKLDESNGRITYMVEMHSRGLIEYKTVVVDEQWMIYDERDGVNAAGVEIPPQVPTGVDDFLVIWVPNYRRSRAFWGVSDYHGMEKHFDEINQRVSRISTCLDILSNPKLQGPDDYLDDQGRFRFANAKYYPRTKDDPEITAIIWDPMLQHHLAALDGYIEKALSYSGIWAGLFNPDKGGQAESGRALKLRMMKTTWRTAKKQIYMGAAIKRLCRVAEELQQAQRSGLGFEAAKPDIEWSEIVPQDELEAAQTEGLLSRFQLTSRKASLRRLRPGLSDEQIEAELEAIEQEEAAGMPEMLTGPRQGSPAAPRTPQLPNSL